eukprot:5257417-Ditylum_brightwellii.AAC.1
MSKFTFSEEINQIIRNVFVRDGCTVSDKYFDAFHQDANWQIGGGMKYVLTSHAHQLSSISKLETAFERSKAKREMFTIAAKQPNFMCSGINYFHY